MRRTMTRWCAAGMLGVAAGAGPAAAQTATPPGLTTPFPGYSGPRTGPAGLPAGTGQPVGTNSGTGVMTGGGGFVGRPARVPLTPSQDVALLVQARLLVTQLEATGALSLTHTESLLLTFLVYESLRQDALRVLNGAAGTGGPAGAGVLTGSP